MKKRLLLAAATAVTALCTAAPAGAVVYVEGTGEPAFTNTTTNTQWVRWKGDPSYSTYRLEFDHYAGSQLVKTEVTGNVSPNGGGVVWVNWAGIVAPLQEGTTYTICGYGRYTIDGYIGSRDTGSCFDADQTKRRASTTIDRTKPTIAVKIDGGAAYSRTAKLNYRVDYADNLAFPFPSNWICRDVGTDPASACANVTHQYNEACSYPVGGMQKVTYFSCDEDLSAASIADGPVTFCAVAADGAIPDNPNGSNQSASAASANRSDRSCDSILIDRAGPQVAVTASAEAVQVGDLVTFGVQASDATSGLAGAYAWKWGDNTGDGAGETATHTFTAPGTYEVRVTTRDNAGNEGTATKVVTVKERTTTTPPPANGGGGTPPPADGGGTPPPTNGGGGTPPPTGGGTPTPPPTSGGGTPVPTEKEISNSAGGGPVQETKVAGLEVLAPRRVKLTGKAIDLAVALTAEGPGRASLALVRAGKVHAQGAVEIAAAGTLGYRLRLPKSLKPGAYQLKISFTPSGATTASTKTAKVTVTPKKKGKGKKARTSGFGPARIASAGTPAGVPTGKAPARPASRRVDLPVR